MLFSNKKKKKITWLQNSNATSFDKSKVHVQLPHIHIMQEETRILQTEHKVQNFLKLLIIGFINVFKTSSVTKATVPDRIIRGGKRKRN